MAQITNEELLAISEGLNYLSSKETKVWYQILKNKKSIKAHVESVSELRKEIIERFSKKDESGNSETDEKGNVFIEDVKSLNEALSKLSKETLVVDFETFSIDELSEYSLESRFLEPLMEKILL